MGCWLADMQLRNKFEKEITFLSCANDLFGKYAWVIPLKDKKVVTIVNTFQKVLDKSDCMPTKIWNGRGNEFDDSSFKKWLQENDIEMYSTHIEGKSVVTERFIRTLKTKADFISI